MVTCMTRGGSGDSCGSRSGGLAIGDGSELLTALASVLRLFPEGSDRVKALSAVLDAGAVPALIRAIGSYSINLKGHTVPSVKLPEPPPVSLAPPGPQADPISTSHGSSSSDSSSNSSVDTRTNSTSSCFNLTTTATTSAIHTAGESAGVDPSAVAWQAVSALEQLLLVGPKSAAPVTAKAALQALASGAVDALLPLLHAAPQTLSQETWRLLRLLLVLERATTGQPNAIGDGAGEGSDATAGGGPPGTPASGGAGAATNNACGRRASTGGAGGLVRFFSCSQPALLEGLLHAARDLLSSPQSLTDSTAESLLLLFAELLTTPPADAAAPADGAALSPARLRHAAPGLAEAAVGVLMGSSPGPQWAAMLPCARERNLAVGCGIVRYAVQLEAAAAKLIGELLGWALAAEGGEDAGWRAWLPVSGLAAALGQRWLHRPGSFESLGDAGVRCLTLSLQLAPPSELWVGESIDNIPRLARKVRAMLERHKVIAAWQLALVAALSAAAGTASSLPSAAPPPPPPLTEEACAEAAAQPGFPAVTQIGQPVTESSPHDVALEMVTHLTSLMATVKLAKLAPEERLGLLAGALNAAVACVAPHRALMRGAAARLLLPTLVKMRLPAPAVARQAPRAGAEAGGAAGAEPCVAVRREALLKAMCAVHARLNVMLAAAMQPAAGAAGSKAGETCGQCGDGDGVAESDGDGVATGGGAGADSGSGGGGSGGDGTVGVAGSDDRGIAVGGGDGGGGGDLDLDGSFADMELAEAMPVMVAALKVGAGAAAVIAEYLMPQ